MPHLLLAIYGALYFFLAFKHFRAALAILIVALPTYLIRFTIGPLPTTLLELMFGIVFVVWLLRYFTTDWHHVRQFFLSDTIFSVSFALFFCASVAGIFISDQWYISLGQWRAYFLEPLLFFIVLVGRRESISHLFLIRALVAATIPVSLVAIGQHFFAFLYPPSLWDDNTLGRATSFFTTPNAIGLFIVPPLLAGIAFIKTPGRSRVLWIGASVLGLAALAFSQSVGAFMGLLAGLLVLVTLVYSRRLGAAAGLVAILLLLLPPTRQLLARKSASMQNRFTLWHYSEQFLGDNPKNFVFGAGIRQFFRKIQKPHYNVKEMERLIYPHNIFLNFWSEIGLFGMLAFSGIYFWTLARAFKIFANRNRLLGAALLASLVALVVHGLVDVPYFKNDLAMLFWILIGIHTLYE